MSQRYVHVPARPLSRELDVEYLAGLAEGVCSGWQVESLNGDVWLPCGPRSLAGAVYVDHDRGAFFSGGDVRAAMLAVLQALEVGAGVEVGSVRFRRSR